MQTSAKGTVMYTLVIGNKNYSSWSLRPWLLLTQFKVDFEEIRIPLHTDEFKEKIHQYSPSGLVPLLCADDLKIWDSLAVCEYIAEQHPDLHCWPQKASARAIARSVSSEMHSGFSQIRSCLPMNCREMMTIDPISAELKKEIERVCEIWASCRQHYANDGDFLFGAFSIADAMYAPVVIRFNNYGIKVGTTEKTYMQSMLSLPSLKSWLSSASAEKEIINVYEQ